MAEVEINRRRHRHQVAQLVALLESGDLDPDDAELAAGLARLGGALAEWFARHGAADAEPRAFGEAETFERVHALMERAGAPAGMGVGEAIAAGLLAEAEVERALNPPDAPPA